nr:rieske region [Streptomyces sp. WM6386]
MSSAYKRERTRHVVFALDELAPGTSRVAELGRRRILVVRDENGELHALSNLCPHQGGPLSGGSVERMWVADRPGEHRRSGSRTVAVCPWHNFETDVSTGCSVWEPRPLRAATYRAEVEDGDVVVYV